MSIAAGLCTRLIVTPQARIGLNGPAVIEQEAGVDEFDSSDHALIWAVDGGEQRRETGLADDLVPDDADLIRAAAVDAVAAGVSEPGRHRSERLDVLAARLAMLDPADPPAPQQLRALWGDTFTPPPGAAPRRHTRGADPAQRPGLDLVARTHRGGGPGAGHPFGAAGRHRHRGLSRSRARCRQSLLPGPRGQVGLTESLALAQAVTRSRCRGPSIGCQEAHRRRGRPAQPGLRAHRGDGGPAPGHGQRRRRLSRARELPDTPSSPSSSEPRCRAGS